MNIEELTIKQARELTSLFNSKPSDDSHWQLGKNYLIRTVTMIQTGKLIKVTDKELVLENAAWVADTGRFTEALAQGTFNEVEMFPTGEQVIIGRGGLIDAVIVSKIPLSQK